MKDGEYLNVKRSSACQQESRLAPIAFVADISDGWRQEKNRTRGRA